MQIAAPNPYAIFPVINATLNGTSALLLLAGRWFIARQRRQAHRNTMIAAFVTSSIFLASYLTYHILLSSKHLESLHFQGQGWVRPFYFTMLLSHTILSIALLPMVIITLRRGLAARFDRHRAIARWTYPIWLYVSVTGVLIYFMLYQWFPA